MNPVLFSVLLLGLLGIACGLLLAWAAGKFQVKTDPRIEQILNALPKTNCGACGYPGCAAAAEAVINGKAKADVCLVGGRETTQEICRIMGQKEIESKELPVAVLRCGAGKELCVERFEYLGEKTCLAEQRTGGGSLACTYGCLAHGDCAKVCPTNAFTLRGKLPPLIDRALCIGCEKCVVACPRNIISMESRALKIVTLCNSQDQGSVTNKICKVGCINCQLCAKKCPSMAYLTGKENATLRIPKVDPAKCNFKLTCLEICPKKTIVRYN